MKIRAMHGKMYFLNALLTTTYIPIKCASIYFMPNIVLEQASELLGVRGGLLDH